MAQLVGRTRELAYLTGMIEATAAGAGGCAVLTGQPGIGKTRLVHHAIQVAPGSGLAVAAGWASELDRVRPLTTLAGALRYCRPEPLELGHLADDRAERFWYLDRLGEAIDDYVARRGLLVVIDDAQWADEFTALALRVLVPALSYSPLRWLLARRPVPADSAAQSSIDWLIHHGDAEQIDLGPLDDDSVRRLCSLVLGAEPDATVLALAARGSGNPFLVGQLLEAMREARQIVIADGFATVVGEELPSGFLSAVQQRLRGLSPPARRLLQAGAVFGRPFTLHAAARVIGVGMADLVSAAEEVLAAEILLAPDERLAFVHDLLREAVYNNAPGPVRAAMHRAAAEVVRADGGPAAEIAEHLTRTGQSGDREAVTLLAEAATGLAGRAPGTAADLIVRALGMLGDHHPDRPRLIADAVGLLASAGRLEQALEIGEEARHRGMDQRTEATLLLGLAEALKHGGQNQAAVDHARRALALPAVADPVRAKLQAIAAHALLYVDDMPGADVAGAEANRLGMAVGEHSAAVFGSAARSVVARAEGRLDDALAHARHGAEVADRVGGEAVHRHPRIWLGAALAALDRFPEADEAYQAGRREAERLGTGWSYPLWHHYRAYLLTSQGRLDEALAEAEGGLRIGERLAAHQLRVPILALLARIALLRDELPLALEHIRQMQRLLATGITAAPEDVTWTLALCHEAEGSPLLAVHELAGIYQRLPDRLLMLCNDPASGPMLVRMAVAAGDSKRAEAAAVAAALLAERNPSVASLAACAAHAAGLLKRDRVALLQAMDLFRDSPRRLARASAAEDTARAEQAAGNRARAVELLEQALAETTACGAHRAATRLERRLVKLGRQRPAVPRQRPRESPLERLTQAELRVARLVAEGRSNRESANELVLSQHTIDSHLRKIFDKFGINNRVELARIMERWAQPPE